MVHISNVHVRQLPEEHVVTVFHVRSYFDHFLNTSAPSSNILLDSYQTICLDIHLFNDAFKALADPSRRLILARLRQEGELNAGELAEQFEMSKPTMSHHFAVLKEAGLVKSRRDGQQIIYSLNTTVVEDVVGALLDLFQPDRNQPATRKKGTKS